MPDRARPVVVLDRDGVINEDSPAHIRSPAEWRPLPGALAAIARLCDAGVTVVVATNQSGIARGLFSEAVLGEIHTRMLAAVTAAGGHISQIYYCPHAPDAGCECRKPRPGMLLRAAAEAGVAASALTFIGDKASDVEAAQAAGARPIWIGEAGRLNAAGITTCPDLATAVDMLIAEQQGRR